jgi:hypothetical protein
MEPHGAPFAPQKAPISRHFGGTTIPLFRAPTSALLPDLGPYKEGVDGSVRQRALQKPRMSGFVSDRLRRTRVDVELFTPDD